MAHPPLSGQDTLEYVASEARGLGASLLAATAATRLSVATPQPLQADLRLLRWLLLCDAAAGCNAAAARITPNYDMPRLAGAR